jgi:hypothetical protein
MRSSQTRPPLGTTSSRPVAFLRRMSLDASPAPPEIPRAGRRARESERAREKFYVRNDSASRVAFLRRMSLDASPAPPDLHKEENGSSEQGEQGRGGVEKGRGGWRKGRGWMGRRG